MNNHYIPRFLLRQFADGEHVNTFDVSAQRFSVKKIKNTFQERDIFSPELEESFAKLEARCGDLLNNRLLPAEETITLNRKENLNLRKMILLDQLRSIYTNRPAWAMYEQERDPNDPDYQFLRSMLGENTDLIMSEKTYYRDLEQLTQYETLEDIIVNAASPTLWHAARTESVSYIAFWDASDTEQEFILPQVQSVLLNDVRGHLHKYHYTEEFLRENELSLNPLQIMTLKNILANVSACSRNFSFHPLSPTRMMVCFSPYFKGFFEQKSVRRGNKVSPYVPPIFPPEKFQEHFYVPMRMELFTPCVPVFNEEYIYTVQKLTAAEVELLNSLTLNEEPEQFVFHDYNRIRDSFYAFEHIYPMQNKKRDYSRWI